MDVELTDKISLETGPVSLDVNVGDLVPQNPERLADGTRSKLTAAPPPILRGASPRKSSASLPPPIPQRAARGTQGPALPRTQTLSGMVSVVAPRASAEMMASWQINPEAPISSGSLPALAPAIARTISPPPIPLAAKTIALAPLPTTLTGNAPNMMVEAPAQVAAPIVRQELVPSPRESRVEPMPTKQPGADVADLPAWPVRAMLPLPSRGRTTSAAPSASPTAAPTEIAATLAPSPTPVAPVAPSVSTHAMPSVLVAPEMVAPRVSALDGSDAWVFEDDYEERRVDGEVVPTTYFERTETGARMLRPRYLVAAGAAAAAIALIVGLAMHSSAEPSPIATKLPAADSVAQRAPVQVPAPTPAVATPNLTSLPITSWPTGAVVTLVDNGAPSVLGPTPVNATLDPSHSYDVMLAVAGRPTTLRHIDLATMHELAVDLDADPSLDKLAAHTATPAAHTATQAAPTTARAAPVVEARPPVAAVPALAEHHHHHHSAPVAAIVTPSFDTPVAAPKPKPVAIAPAAGNGVLMISAKPPCEIIIDGKSTHLTTPQRSIAVAAGPHTVLLVNASIGIKKSIAVKVDPKKPTKLIQDFTKG